MSRQLGRMTDARKPEESPRGGRLVRLAAGILREPLVGFTLAGLAMFSVMGFDDAGDERPTIEISAATIDDVLSYRSEILGRALALEEKQALIDDFVAQEILVREAAARGLHLHDSRVRARLVAKMAFLLEDEPPEPGAADLAARLTAEPGRYQTPMLITFDHVFFSDDRGAAAAALASLVDGSAEPADLGVTFWLGQRMERYTLPQLLTVLGYGFTGRIRNLPRGEWTGPVRSARGWHLVRLETVYEPERLAEPELTRRLTEDWKAARRADSRRRRLADLRATYDVRLPASAGTGPGPTPKRPK